MNNPESQEVFFYLSNPKLLTVLYLTCTLGLIKPVPCYPNELIHFLYRKVTLKTIQHLLNTR